MASKKNTSEQNAVFAQEWRSVFADGACRRLKFDYSCLILLDLGVNEICY